MFRFHEFSRTSGSTKTEKLVKLPKYATNYNLSGSIQVHETSHFGHLFKIIELKIEITELKIIEFKCFVFVKGILHFYRVLL